MDKSISELFDLTGQVAVVTGAAMGIGKGIAQRLAEAGAAVLVADINMEAADATVKEFESSGFKASSFKSDTSKVEDAEKTMNDAVARFGDLNILVNNAGIYPFSPALDLTEAMWDKTQSINLKGVMFFSQAAARVMKKRGHGGKIINIASIDAFHPTGNIVHYDVSKGGVVTLTKSLAKEWAPEGIIVNAIAPGGIATPGGAAGTVGLTPEQIKEMTRAFVSKIPLGRMGKPDDVATVALFLASEASAYVCGATIVADGGYLVG